MAITRKRSSNSASITKNAIAQVSSALGDLPEKPKENLSLRETIGELHDSITVALNRGYSYEEIVDILASQGIEITVASLKRYLASARKEQGVSLRPRRAKRTGGRGRSARSEQQTDTLSGIDLEDADQSEEADAAEEAESSEPTTPTRKRRQSKTADDRSRTAAKTQSTSKTTRSTSSRRRK